MAGKEDGVEAGSAGCAAAVDVDVRKLVTDGAVDLEAFFGEALRQFHFDAVQGLHRALDGLEVFDVLAQFVDLRLDCCHSLVFFLGRRDPSLEFWCGWVSGHDGHGHVLEFFFGRLTFERLVEGPVPLVVLGEALCLLVALLVLDFHMLAALAHAIVQTFQYRADDLLQAGLALFHGG
ncbi:hypothetical protein [Mitsuokella jalaludinii]|uniref:hypothetical protein n=1 Tax=Mitsuokella jalaludinii TaxID=187979 RepID=UPI003AF87450